MAVQLLLPLLMVVQLLSLLLPRLHPLVRLPPLAPPTPPVPPGQVILHHHATAGSPIITPGSAGVVRGVPAPQTPARPPTAVLTPQWRVGP